MRGFAPAVFLSVHRFGFRFDSEDVRNSELSSVYRSGMAYTKRLPERAVCTELP